MQIKKRLISLMLAASIGVGAATMTGCGSLTKTPQELECENEIRKILQYDANINIDRKEVEDRELYVDFNVSENNEFLIKFHTKKAISVGKMIHYVMNDEITYSVDKDFYYYFKEEYSTKETQKEVDLIKELTTKYDPIKVVDDNVEKDIINNL